MEPLSPPPVLNGQDAPGLSSMPRARQQRLARLRSPFLAAFRNGVLLTVALLGFVLATAGLVYFAWRNTSHLVVITVDEHNHTVRVGAPEVPESRQVLATKGYLAQVVVWVREVPGDLDLLKQNWSQALAFMAPEGVNVLKMVGREMRPDQIAKEWRVRVSIHDEIQPVTKSSYLVEWTERRYKLPNMTPEPPKRFHTVLSFTLDPPPVESPAALINPFGIRIYDVNWRPQPAVFHPPGSSQVATPPKSAAGAPSW